MVDVALIKVKAGDGGNGKVSFRREKYVTKGGPDGGDGGDGGSVVLVGERNLRTLDYFAGRQKFEARQGEGGRKQKQSGKSQEDVYIQVPQGCVVWQIDGINDVNMSRKQLFELLHDSKSQMEVIHTDGDKEGRRANHEYRITRLGEILEDGEELMVAKGGKGGRGNDRFKSSRNTTPREAEGGVAGEERWLVLELKLLADVGLVGLPNVGKSTLLSVLTAARPKIADYEFTTLEPNLGVIQATSTKHQASSEVVIADIPGLIEGASEGKGLGDEFLRHVERCRVLVHVLAPKIDVVVRQRSSLAEVVKQMVGDYKTIRQELGEYDQQLVEKPEIVVVNKRDLMGDWLLAVSGLLEEELKKMGVGRGSHQGSGRPGVLWVSAATGEGVEELVERLRRGMQG